jgi:histidine triad (HIT) family protein
MPGCLFCQIVEGAVPCEEVYSDDEFLAFRDINPQAPAHVLIIPKKHVARINDAEPDDAALLGRMLLKANDIAESEGLDEDGFRFVINSGVNGGQSVYHVHLHILGGRQMMWPPG